MARFNVRSVLANPSGFTLLEMLIALAVFSFGMLGLTSLFAMQVNMNANAIRQNVANNIALGAIEEAKSVPYYRMIDWNPTQASATVPCQGSVAAAQANRADCLLPDSVNPAAPAAPYNRLISDVNFTPISNLGGSVSAQANRAFTQGMEVRRTFTIVTDSPVADMKTITVQVDWRLAGNADIHTIRYATIRDMDIR